MKSVRSVNHFKSEIQTSYDIIKAHGGEIRVETKEGEGGNLLFNCQHIHNAKFSLQNMRAFLPFKHFIYRLYTRFFNG